LPVVASEMICGTLARRANQFCPAKAGGDVKTFRTSSSAANRLPPIVRQHHLTCTRL
jgi:hypothetical protein